MKALFCKYGHERTPGNLRSRGGCRTCTNEHRRGIRRPVVYEMCRRGLHDLRAPGVARVNDKGRECIPCAKTHLLSRPARPRKSRRLIGPPKRYAIRSQRPPRPHLCKYGHDIDVVGLFGKKCNACRVRPRPCKAGHTMVGLQPGGCYTCRGLLKRSREHTKRARHYGSVVLNTKATGWRSLIDGEMCVYCGFCPATTLDHVIPLKRGGVHSDSNLVAACLGCNSSKGDRLLSEWKGRVCPGCGGSTGAVLDGPTYVP